jgi:hypothetical protein
LDVEERALSDLERGVLERILSVEFEGADRFREQIPNLRVIWKCDCGCPTVDFRASGVSVQRLLEAEGRIAPRIIGGAPAEVIVFERDGVLSSLEYVYYDGNPPAEFPDPVSIDVWSNKRD